MRSDKILYRFTEPDTSSVKHVMYLTPCFFARMVPWSTRWISSSKAVMECTWSSFRVMWEVVLQPSVIWTGLDWRFWQTSCKPNFSSNISLDISWTTIPWPILVSLSDSAHQKSIEDLCIHAELVVGIQRIQEAFWRLMSQLSADASSPMSGKCSLRVPRPI